MQQHKKKNKNDIKPNKAKSAAFQVIWEKNLQ